jgi:hypothetical protein
MLSLDDFSQDPEHMRQAAEFAKEIAAFLKQKYPDKFKRCPYGALIGADNPQNRTAIPQAILFKLKEMLNEPRDKSPYLDEECIRLVEEVFEIIKDNYSNDVTKLHRLAAALEDNDSAYSFLFDLCHM